jgi:hypothetical protein
MRRAGAIRAYVTDREQKESANRALRVLEMAVGGALPDATEAMLAGVTLDSQVKGIHYKDRQRFRSLHEHAGTDLDLSPDTSGRPTAHHTSQRHVDSRNSAVYRAD